LSCIAITIASVKYFKSQKPGYSPLLNKLPTTNNNYGSTTITNDTASDDTAIMDIEIKSSRWTIYNVLRFLFSMVQLGLFISIIDKVNEHKYEFSINEGSVNDILVAYGTHVIFWVC
jgi:hypothetical protein